MSKVFKRLTSKWSIPGWVLLVFWFAFGVLDWIDRLQSAVAKAVQVMPLLQPFLNLAVSRSGQLVILLVGLLLLFLATWRQELQTEVTHAPIRSFVRGNRVVSLLAFILVFSVLGVLA